VQSLQKCFANGCICPARNCKKTPRMEQTAVCLLCVVNESWQQQQQPWGSGFKRGSLRMQPAAILHSI